MVTTICFKTKENATNFVTEIQKLDSDFDIKFGHTAIDAKSILGVLTLDLSKTYHLNCELADGEKEIVETIINKYKH